MSLRPVNPFFSLAVGATLVVARHRGGAPAFQGAGITKSPCPAHPVITRPRFEVVTPVHSIVTGEGVLIGTTYDAVVSDTLQVLPLFSIVKICVVPASTPRIETVSVAGVQA